MSHTSHPGYAAGPAHSSSGHSQHPGTSAGQYRGSPPQQHHQQPYYQLPAQASIQRNSSSASASSHYGPPNSSARLPRTQSTRRQIPPCPQGVDPMHWKWFNTVDTDGSGQISPQELQQALINGDHTKFENETVKLLFGMFDLDRSGTLGLEEFVSIFKYVEQWQGIFRRFDADKSGTIEAPELARAMQEFQYNLAPHLIDLLCTKYSALSSGPSLGPPGITFDRFVRCCVSVKTLTDAFMAVDTDRDGYATISYDQFLSMVLSAP